MHGETVHVSNRPSHGHRKAGSLRMSAHKAHSVAPQGKLACPKVLGKTYPLSQVNSQASTVVATRRHVLVGQHLHPLQHAIRSLPMHQTKVKAHLGDFTARGLWSVPESRLHINFLELKAVLLALKCFKHCQYHCCCLHKQGGGYEIRFSLCPSLETPVIVQCQEYCPTCSPYARQGECDSGQTIPSQPSYSDRMVSPKGDI